MLRIPGLKEFVRLVYPRICTGCGHTLYETENEICTACILKLPKTDFHKSRFNPLRKLLQGRVKVNDICAYCYFDKGSKVQRILHAIKYQGKRDLAVIIGEWYAHDLKSASSFSRFDCIVPVPLHPARLAVRGYNQSTAFGHGLSNVLKSPLNDYALYRTAASSTQTRKSRVERWENVESIFAVRSPGFFQGKSVLLVDDVITTGATLEACANVMYADGLAELRIVTIACALKI